MPYNGSGTFSRPVAAYVFDTTISETDMNTEMDGIATGLTTALTKDGQTTPTANLPMGGYKHTGVANASSRDEYVALGQVQDGGGVWCGTATGTANAITLTPSPAITAYAAGQRFVFLAASTNTSTVTVTVSGVSAKAVQLYGNALEAGDIISGRLYIIWYDGSQFQLVGDVVSVPEPIGRKSAVPLRSSFYIAACFGG